MIRRVPNHAPKLGPRSSAVESLFIKAIPTDGHLIAPSFSPPKCTLKYESIHDIADERLNLHSDWKADALFRFRNSPGMTWLSFPRSTRFPLGVEHFSAAILDRTGRRKGYDGARNSNRNWNQIGARKGPVQWRAYTGHGRPRSISLALRRAYRVCG